MPSKPFRDFVLYIFPRKFGRTEVFSVDGQNSIVPIDGELAIALKNAPEGNVNIRLVTESGAALDSEIGKETVGSWKTIY